MSYVVEEPSAVYRYEREWWDVMMEGMPPIRERLMTGFQLDGFEWLEKRFARKLDEAVVRYCAGSTTVEGAS